MQDKLLNFFPTTIINLFILWLVGVIKYKMEHPVLLVDADVKKFRF